MTQTAAEGPPSDTTVTRHIDLDPADWFWATWRNLDPLPRPAPQPFAPDRCAARLAKVGANQAYHRSYQWQWEKAAIAPSLTREEACFWFAAMTPSDLSVTAKEFGLYLARQDFTTGLTPSVIRKHIKNAQGYLPAEIMLPLAMLLPVEDIVALILDITDATSWRIRCSLYAGFCHYLRPYLSREQTVALRELVREQLPTVPLKNFTSFPPALPMAALLGMEDVIRPTVFAWADGSSARNYGPVRHYRWIESMHVMVFGLDSAQQVEFHGRRLGLRLDYPQYIRAWLAHTEYAALDLIRDGILSTINKDECDDALEAFCLVHAPEAAPHMLELRHSAKAPARARQWLDDHPGIAVAGLIPVAAGRGKVADMAVEFLRDVKRRGFTTLLDEQLAVADPAVADAVRPRLLDNSGRVSPTLDETTTPNWLKTALAETPTTKAKLPGWARPSSLPPLLVGERCFNEAQVNAVLVALQKSTVSIPAPLVLALCQHVERPVLDAFAWKLFELWRSEGSLPKEKWAFTALGHLGGDASVMKLTPLVKVWPGESQHARAVTGLECLRRIGTDVALMQLNSIAQKLKFKGLQNRARVFMEEIANDRGMTRTQLEDRIVPDLDLDERGSRVFDFGPRQFRFVLDADMKPMIRDDADKLKSDLPKPNSKDDADRAKAAVDAWKLLKKQIKDVVKIQAVRLEQAMVASRRWSVADFEKLLVRHPLMINLVRRLLWGGFDKTGKLQRSFRVTEEQEYASSSDTATSLDGLHEIGIVHPLHLSDDERGKWGEVFGDYEIIAPFPQLGRRVHKLLPNEQKAKEITRFNGPKINPMALVGILDKLGWQRGTVQDGGVYHYHTKEFPTAAVTAVIQYAKGVPVGYIEGWEDQTLERGYFVPHGELPGWYQHDKAVQWGQIDPVVVSEVLGAMAVLASKGT